MANSFEFMPSSLSTKLVGLSVNEAIKNGFITQVGDENGNFIFSDADQADVYYALFSGYLIRCSESIIQSGLEISEIAGGLTFYKYVLNGVELYKLGMPNNVKLGNVVFQLNK